MKFSPIFKKLCMPVKATLQATPPRAASSAMDRRVGRRFWALSDGIADSEGEAGHSDGEEPPAGSPTPSDAICEAFRMGYEEHEVALLVDLAVPCDDPARSGLKEEDIFEIVRRIVHRPTAASAIRPWRGPLPKVSLPKPTLSDFFEAGA